MGKTYRKDKRFLPKKQGKVFTKNSSWKNNKHRDRVVILTEPQENI